MSSRRDFLKSGLIGMSSLGLLSSLTSCSTIDDFIFDSRQFSDNQVLIVGGGISGLHLAYKLRQSKTDYKIFEGSTSLGGRVRSSDGLDFGASFFEQSDLSLLKLVKEFNLPVTSTSSTNFYLTGGAEQLIDALKNRIGGLMPYRSIRLKWKMIEIKKYSESFEIAFDTPEGLRTVRARKVALTLPPSQWSQVNGLLSLPEMSWAPSWLKTLQPESILKMHYTLPIQNAISIYKKSKVKISEDTDLVNVLAKNLKNNSTGLEFEIYLKQKMNQQSLKIETDLAMEPEKIIALINSKTKLGLSVKKVSADSFYNWSDVALIQSAYFKNSVPFPESVKKESPFFQVFGDYSASLKPHTVEGSLQESERVSSIFV